MRVRRGAILFLACATVATACGSNDPGAEPSATTVPSATTTPTTTGGPANPGKATTSTTASTTTTAPDPRSIDGDLTRVAVVGSLLGRYEEPVDTTVAPNGELWLAERGGTVSVLDPATGRLGDTVLDLSAETVAGGERGLLGLAADDDHVYVNFTDLEGDTVVDAFTLDADGRPDRRHHLLSIEQPFANHNGGGLRIGPDRHLYIGVGDGGSGGDPLGAGQDPNQLPGSLLRIDPTPGADTPYAIPADNPYADGGGRPEVFAIGLRNPWRFSFDPVTDDLWIADVGQNEWEEVNLLLGDDGFGNGANLGWNRREGTHEFSGSRPDDNVDPVFEYPHQGDTPFGCAVSGGVVYRGLAIPELVGSYVFGDHCEPSLWALSTVDDTVVFRDLGVPIRKLVAVTTDADGELLALSLGGDVTRIAPR